MDRSFCCSRERKTLRVPQWLRHMVLLLESSKVAAMQENEFLWLIHYRVIMSIRVFHSPSGYIQTSVFCSTNVDQ